MIATAISIGFVLVTIATALALYRLIRGPSAPDRILALDTLYVNAIAFLVLTGMQIESDVFFEAALLLAMMGFVGTVSLSKHVQGRSVIE
jgi:multicomponent K+:H+ antiporter subunit F